MFMLGLHWVVIESEASYHKRLWLNQKYLWLASKVLLTQKCLVFFRQVFAVGPEMLALGLNSIVVDGNVL